MRRKQGRCGFSIACALAVASIGQAQTATETILHSFGYFPQGDAPCGTLIRDPAGNLYGTTFYGGSANLGVVFEFRPSAGYRVLHSFAGGADGANPYAGVAFDGKGNLYGTTYAGGAANAGAVYKIDASGVETVLYAFTGGADGSTPYAGVALDGSGNLYGTTFKGGTANAGVVYKLDPAGQETVLYTFSGGADGANPYAGVVLDAQGNLYGTTSGGDPVFGGLIYKVSPSGQETVIYNKLGALRAGVIRDAAGNLYSVADAYVFKISPSGQYTQLGIFDQNVDGGVVTSALTMDGAGNLFGTTAATTIGQEESPHGGVFEVSPGALKVKVLYRFPGLHTGTGGQGFDVNNPGLVLDGTGNLYGVTQDISLGGAIYELSASGTESVLYQFRPAPGGSSPYGPLIRDRRGNIYGTTGSGGPVNQGVLYELTSSGENLLPPNAGTAGASVAADRQGNLYVAGGSTLPIEGPGNIYKVAPSGASTLLYSFTGGTDGNGSLGVVVDSVGNVYGVSTGGGAPNGLVFKLSVDGQFVILYSFTGGADGSDPNYQLTLDAAGNLYGSTAYGGGGAGLVYRLSPSGQQTVLHSFNGFDGDIPEGRVTLDAAGNLYGTTSGGGTMLQGVLYKLNPGGVFTALHNFSYDNTGASPLAGPTLDSAGNLYGTTTGGGDLTCTPFGGGNDPIGCGVVYEFVKGGSYSVLHTFEGGVADGAGPEGEVTVDFTGSLYGTTPYGGAAASGVVYKVTRRP